jgi:hypothetical protein
MFFLSTTVSGNRFSLTVLNYPPVKKYDFYWPLVLVILKNASINRLRTVTIELLYTSVIVMMD